MDSKVMDILADRVLELGPKPDADSPYRNFKLTRDGDGVAWLLFDRAGASANSATAAKTYPFMASFPPANVRTYEIRPKTSVASGYRYVKETCFCASYMLILFKYPNGVRIYSLRPRPRSRISGPRSKDCARSKRPKGSVYAPLRFADITRRQYAI